MSIPAKSDSPYKIRVKAAEQGARRVSAPLVVWLVLSCIWGSTWLFIKLGLEDLPPVSFAGVRFAIASAILLVVVAARRAPVP
ncbi:MAG TPA: EamA family transporter, partial [Blastocatellia bacterium]|nr:EamA family transporter [Blastocatellia bacterium]